MEDILIIAAADKVLTSLDNKSSSPWAEEWRGMKDYTLQKFYTLTAALNDYAMLPLSQ